MTRYAVSAKQNDSHGDDLEETGLRLCAERSATPESTLPRDVFTCCWDALSSPGKIKVGLCDRDGSFIVVTRDAPGNPPESREDVYAVYFNILPMHHLEGNGAASTNQISRSSTTARRVGHAWSQVAFVPGQENEIVFVQRWSPKILWTKIPGSNLSGRQRQPTSGRFGLSDGSRIVALDGHEAQVQCLAFDGTGVLLVTGDESGVICVRTLSRGATDIDAVSTGGSRDVVSSSSAARGGQLVTLGGAHPGGVLAVTRVYEGSSRERGHESGHVMAHFASGGVGGVVRVWRAVSSKEGSMEPGTTGLRVEPLADMLVGRSEVSSLASSGLSETPLVLAGTKAGTVFGFEVNVWFDPCEERNGAPALADGSERENASDIGDENQQTSRKDRLWRLRMKFEHTNRGISCISCSKEQEVIATADTEGIVRTYRPLSPEHPDRRASAMLPWQLVVECRLGSAPVLCEFALEPSPSEEEHSGHHDDDATGHDRTRWGMLGDPATHSTAAPLEEIQKSRPDSDVMGREDGRDRRRRSVGRLREVLRTCARDGRMRVWPTSTLPVRPMRTRPLPVQPPSSPPSPPSHHPMTQGVHNQAGPGARAPGAPRSSGLRDAQSREGSEGRAHAPDPGTARGAEVTGGAAGQIVLDVEESPPADLPSRPGQHDGVERAATGRNSNSSQGTRPAQPRRVSFASSEQVYELPDDGSHGSEYGGDGIDGEAQEEDIPQGLPPLPTPVSGPAHPHPQRLQKARNAPVRNQGDGRPVPDARDGGQPARFVHGSGLEGPSLCSSVVEDVVLEERMAEEFDASTAKEPPLWASRAAASASVNIHPLAKTFDGLVPVSLDAPPLRPKRKGKQVDKAHLCRLEEGRITEEDLVFEDIEPKLCSYASAVGPPQRHHPRVDLKWDESQREFSKVEDPSRVAYRVWSLGSRP